MYTIGQIAKMMNLSVPTLRYYDDEGILINIKRDNAGNRIFDDSDVEALKIINCLKQSGLKIKEIKEFMDLCRQGNSSLKKKIWILFKPRTKGFRRNSKPWKMSSLN